VTAGAAPALPDLRLSRAETVVVGLLYGGILATTAVAFVLAFEIGTRYQLPSAAAGYAPTFGLLALLMYVFGLRHGVDADHIAAIDNTTRKLLHDGKRPLTVGTWFSLGHSTIVVAMIVAVIAATEFVADRIAEFRAVGAVLGTSVSGVFLCVIGLINVIIVVDIYRVFRNLREGRYQEGELEAQMNERGFMSRYFGSLFRVIEKPWQIYPVGVLFGLGFDTASEVALIAIAVGVGITGFPLWAVLVLPLMFLCGMVLVDTTDAVAMRFVYGWAFLKPIRKVYYNLTITIISVLIAFAVGGVELLQVLSGELRLEGGFWDALNALDFETLGLGIIVLFFVAWIVAYAIYRIRGYENTGLGPAPPRAS
jgi:high-affinity nickel-transport protein